MKNIPAFELARQYRLIREEIEAASAEILSSGRYIGGTVVKDFEREFAQYIGTAECVSCNSGTDALYLALRALEIGQGDEVITTPFTFIATTETIVAVGAKPVFVDIDRETYNINLQQIEAAITPRTKAIIPVHLFGQPVDMSRLMAIANARNLFVVEDCAQATGAEWANQKVGSIGHIGCFSFYPTKNLGACGDGGALTTNDRAIALSLRMLSDHGRSDTYLHHVTGINSRLDAIQAAILRVKLRYLDSWNSRRDLIAGRYQTLFRSIDEIILPQPLPEGKSVWNQYTIRIKNKRDKIRSQLQSMGVNSAVYYPIPLHLQPVYQDLGYQKGQLPVSEQVAREVLSLPMFPELSLEEQQQVAYGLKELLVSN